MTQRLQQAAVWQALRRRLLSPFAALKKFLKKHVQDEELAVLDKKLGGIVQEKMGIPCVYRSGRPPLFLFCRCPMQCIAAP